MSDGKIHKNRTHGEAFRNTTTEYRIWSGMLARTRNSNHRYFGRYGGRGIKVCDRWLKYENFLTDMGRKPSPEHSIDRINNDGDYEPGNCRWATKKEQGNNTSTVRWITYKGETKTLRQWAKHLDMSDAALHYRLKNMTLFRAFEQPKSKWK